MAKQTVVKRSIRYVRHPWRIGWNCVNEVGIFYDFVLSSTASRINSVMLRARQLIGYDVSRQPLSFGTGFAALLVDTQTIHALCKILTQ